MIVAGMESHGGTNFNSSFITGLESVYEDLFKLSNLYRKQVLGKSEFEDNFELIAKHFNQLTLDSFNLPCKLRSSNIFGIMTIFNVDEMDTIYNIKNEDVKTVTRQLKSFKQYLVNNTVTIDLKTYRVEGLPEGTIMPLFINVKEIYKLNKEDFITIILHEIGHVISLLEMYANTSNSIVSMMDDFVNHNSQIGQLRKFKLSTSNIHSEADVTIRIYDYFNEKILKTKLPTGRLNNDTDKEFEADAFVVRFGYGGDLTKALNKLNQVEKIDFLLVTKFTILFGLFYTLISFLILIAFFSVASTMMILIFSLVAEVALKLVSVGYSQNGRNPSDIPHGTLQERFLKIRLTMVGLLRKSGLNKNDQKELLHQLRILDNEMDILDKSAVNSILGGMLSKQLTTNLNIRDNLALTLESLINNDLYISGAKLSAGLESAGYVGRRDILTESITDTYTKLLDLNLIDQFLQYDNMFAEIEDVVYTRLGIPIKILPATFFNSGVGCFPFNFLDQTSLSNFNTLHNTKFNLANLITGDSSEKLITDLKRGLQITINRKINRITGLDKKRHVSLVLLDFGRDITGKGYKDSAIALNPEEATAITLHELGHLFTYIESMVKTVHTNTLLQDALLEYDNEANDIRTITYDERMEKVYKNRTTIAGNILELTKTASLTTIHYLLSTFNLFAYGNPEAVLMGNSSFDSKLGTYSQYKTDTEVLADDFATKFGMGSELASGLRKLVTMNASNPLSTVIVTYTTLTKSILRNFITGKLFNTVHSKLHDYIIGSIIATTNVWFMGFIARLVLNSNMPYEKLPKRIKDIRTSLVDVLRTSKLSKEETKEVLKQIDNISQEIETIKKAGFESLVLSILIPNGNIGKDIKDTKLLTDKMSDLINNDLYVVGNKLDAGMEAGEPTILYHNTYRFSVSRNFTKSKMDLLIGKGEPKKDLIRILNKYNITCDIKSDTDVVNFEFYTDYKANIYSGITTVSIVPTDIVTSVILITTDADKIEWQLRNPSIEIYNVDTVKVTDILTYYVCEIEFMEGLNKGQQKINKKVMDTLTSLDKDYGIRHVDSQLEAILKIKSLPKHLKNQYVLLNKFIQNLPKDKHDNIWLDLHDGNTMVNSKKQMVITDPFVSNTVVGSKVSNNVKLSLDLLNKNNPIKHRQYSSVYHMGKKGYTSIKTLAQQGKLGRYEKGDEQLKEVSLFIGKPNCEYKLRHQVNGFNAWKDVTTLYTIDLLDNVKNIEAIELSSTPQEIEYHDEHWDKFVTVVNKSILKKYGNLDSDDSIEMFVKQKRIYKQGMYDYLLKEYDIKETMTLTEYLDSPYLEDWSNPEYFVKNTKKGSKEQYATTIPHIIVKTKKPLKFIKEENIC